MAQWGIAYAIGPNYNKVWDMFPYTEKKTSLAVAQKAIAQVSALLSPTVMECDMERAMLEALATRYPDNPEVEEIGPYNDAFADAMRGVHQLYPNNLDVLCIFVEALMGRTSRLTPPLYSSDGDVSDARGGTSSG
jgi:hypothetical protein